MKFIQKVLNRPDLAYLLQRVTLGVVGIYFGWKKFTPEGFSKLTETTEKMGFPLPTVFAGAAAASEVVGGGLLILGLLTRTAGFFFFFTMLVATVMVNIPRNDPAMISLTTALGVMALSMVFTGPGKYTVTWIKELVTPKSSGAEKSK